MFAVDTSDKMLERLVAKVKESHLDNVATLNAPLETIVCTCVCVFRVVLNLTSSLHNGPQTNTLSLLNCHPDFFRISLRAASLTLWSCVSPCTTLTTLTASVRALCAIKPVLSRQSGEAGGGFVEQGV